ncbi:chemotaxis protein CheX [Aestuariirhabdus sp. Z084]|uniref:chemotaxis protein CheX n=1 Tax=Aestuariirhabdus haliotis TaxID=2918751 RepID=UPI00201B3AED|nr:chemotaxis protein CheX [Aestuariirhabdus haliotis]MCL6415845.1 chemotaxis protein CheX [Aestuariirhabdus haliotis]MCL6419853.1 chemotaxis protein CheX [Aestuariirhabdus haliotis]
MVEAEIEIFIQCVEKYFSKRSKEKIIIETPYLTENISRTLSDYTGIISISGAYKGSIYFTAPSEFLKQVLLDHGQSDFSVEYLADAIGEVTNTLSGNSRKSLGRNFVISVPKVIQGNSQVPDLTDGAHSFVVPLKWHGHSAAMVVSVMNS